MPPVCERTSSWIDFIILNLVFGAAEFRIKGLNFTIKYARSNMADQKFENY